MIEIVFSDSACGSLKMAQNYGKGKYSKSAIEIISTPSDGYQPTKEELETVRQEIEEKERTEWEQATPLGGNSKDIYGFNLQLSVGVINEDDFFHNRQQVLKRTYSIYPENIDVQADIIDIQISKLDEIRNRVMSGDTLRIWYSDQPDEMCGLYWLVSELNKVCECYNQIYLVKLSELEFNDDYRIQSWGEVSPGKWHKYLQFQKQMTKVHYQEYINRWKALKDTQLRAVLNGQLVGVPEDIYDSFIIREILAEDEEFHEAMIIGRVIGKYQLGISDSWISLRIEKMINDGKLEVVTAATKNVPIYHQTLRRCYL